MERVLEGLTPREVFFYFEEIAQIPRGSGNEKQISDYLVEFARARNYDVVQDEHWNVVINVPGTKGYEKRKKIILQAHMDMVCQKEDGVDFDFEKSPISLCVDGDYIRAQHTTLGADDGFGIAMCLAIMDSPSIAHAPLQFIFTVREEVGLVGASLLNGEWINGEYLIGLDCSRDDIIMVSCAGMSQGKIELPIRRISLDEKDLCALNLSIHGLRGGHSGNMIHLGRANALKVMGEILAELMEKLPIHIAKVSGGTLINVIPSQAECVICCPKAVFKQLMELLREIEQKVTKAFRRTDPDLRLQYETRSLETQPSCIHPADALALASILDIVFTGAHTMMNDNFSMAESSVNLAILTEEPQKIVLQFNIRSNSEYLLDNLIRKYKTIANCFHAHLYVDSRISPWEYNPDSLLQKKVADLYRELNGESAEIKIIHACVEGGIFMGKVNELGHTLDIVNIGCNNLNVHTPQEMLQISSVGKTYLLLKNIIKELD